MCCKRFGKRLNSFELIMKSEPPAVAGGCSKKIEFVRFQVQPPATAGGSDSRANLKLETWNLKPDNPSEVIIHAR